MNVLEELDGVELEFIEEHFINGRLDSLPEYLVEYLGMMKLLAGRLQRWDTGTRKNHVAFFMETHGLTKPKAEQLYRDTIEFYYIEQETDLEAYANYYAQRLESLANATVQLASNEKGMKVAGGLLKDAMYMRAKYRPQEAAYPKELLEKKTVIYQDNKRLLGESTQSRTEIAQQIDSWEIPEHEKIRLRAEAGVTDPKLFLDEPDTANGEE